MSLVRILTEFTIRLPDRAESVAKISELLRQRGIELIASTSYWQHNQVVLMLVPREDGQLGQVLRDAGHKPQAKSVLVIGPQQGPGIGPLAALQLEQAGISVLYSYAAWTDTGESYLVLSTTDNVKAARRLRMQEMVDGLTLGRVPPVRPAPPAATATTAATTSPSRQEAA